MIKMSDSLRNKVVVITGASSGIGRSIALESASRGATVVLLARRLDKLEEIAAEARELSASAAFAVKADLGLASDIEAAFAEVKEKVKHIDYLVNAAGFGKFEEFMEADMQDATELFQVDVLGLMYMSRLFGRLVL